MSNKIENYTKSRYVAMLDIMGFKAIVEKKASSRVYSLLKKVYNEATNQSSYAKLKISIFSDTILIISDNDTQECYEDIVKSSAYFANLFIKNGYAINGAIAFGSVTFDEEKNICFGKPIIDAHLMQEDLFFYGIVLHETAEKKRWEYKSVPFYYFQGMDVVIDLKIPLKSKGWVKMYCVNWCEAYFPHNATFQDQISPIKTQIDELYKSSQKSGRGAYYVMNTEVVLKQWFDFTAEKGSSEGWGKLISEERITNCPTCDNQ